MLLTDWYRLWSQRMLTACQAPPWEWHKAAAQGAWRSRPWLVAQRTVAQAVAPEGEVPLSGMWATSISSATSGCILEAYSLLGPLHAVCQKLAATITLLLLICGLC